MKNRECTALVVSCDAYADVVPAFIALWRKFWPDCPFETVLLTETVPCDGFGCPGVSRFSTCVSPEMIQRSLPAFQKLAESYGL